MFSLFKKFRAWRLGRFLRIWEKKRANGKGHFVAGFALFWSLFLTGSYTLLTFIFNEPIDIAMVTVRLIIGFLGGLLIGWLAWRSNEKVFLANTPTDDLSAADYPWGEEQAADPEKFDADWKRDWQSMPHRDVVDLTNLNKIRDELAGYEFGKIIAARTALIPEKYISGSYFRNEVYPLCLRSTIPTERLAASIYPTFEKIDHLGFCVWVHEQCFKILPLRDDQPGVPW